MKGEKNLLDCNQIQQIIPHRYPFLLVDRIEKLISGKMAVGIKNVTMNEYYFQGHFPQEKIMPGVLIIEALAQVGAVALLKEPENQGKLAYFAGINKARFRKKVVPGDVLKLTTEIIRKKGFFGIGKALATVNGEIAAEAELLFALEKN